MKKPLFRAVNSSHTLDLIPATVANNEVFIEELTNLILRTKDLAIVDTLPNAVIEGVLDEVAFLRMAYSRDKPFQRLSQVATCALRKRVKARERNEVAS